MKRPTAIVVGSGIAGMTAAYRLKQAGYSVRVLEKEDVIGGRMSCRRINGFTFNRAATLLGGSYDFLKGLIDELGLGDRLTYNDFKIGTFRGGKIYPIRTNRVIIDSISSGLLSWRAKLLMSRVVWDAHRAREYLDFTDLSKAAPIDNETVAAYAKRCLNQELLDYVVDPVMAAVLATTPARASIVDLLFSIQHYIGMGAYRFDGGIDFLIHELARQVSVETCAPVRSVCDQGDHVTVSWERRGTTREENCDACVIAVSANQVPDLYDQLQPTQRDILAGYEYTNIISCQFGLDRDPGIDAEYILIPQREIQGLIILLLPHRMFGQVAPPGKGIVTACSIHEWSDAHMDDSDEQIVNAMLPKVERVIPDIRDHIEVTNVTRWAPALFASKPGSYKAMARLKETMDSESRVQLAGDYFAFSSTNSSASSGDSAATRIIESQCGQRL